jgi:hypothetical protein
MNLPRMKFMIREKDTFHQESGRVLEEAPSYEEARRRICALKAVNPLLQAYVSVEYPKCKSIFK